MYAAGVLSCFNTYRDNVKVMSIMSVDDEAQASEETDNNIIVVMVFKPNLAFLRY